MHANSISASALRARVEREDIVLFINACFAATGQHQYYTDRAVELVSIGFLHEYVRVNYRQIYARVLAAGINHFNQGVIVASLLRAGAPDDPAQREEEGALIAAALRALPPNRVFALFDRLRALRVNNRRTRAVMRRYLAQRPDPAFDAVKYRAKVRAAVAHAHAELDDETGALLFRLAEQKRFETPLFETFRRAHYTQQAVYELPFTVAESLAAKHGIPRERFLERIEPKMTAQEKLRLQRSAERGGARAPEIDLGRAPLTRLALFIAGLPRAERETRQDELEAAMQRAATRAVSRAPLSLGRVAAVLDRSRSSWGSRERRRRPFAVALAASYLLRAASREYRALWTPEATDDAPELLLEPGGQTAIAAPLLDALAWRPDLIVIVSDGFENDPSGAAHEILRVYQARLSDAHPIDVVHANPVFDAQHFSPRPLTPHATTVGLRDAEDLPTMLGFARFASGRASLAQLDQYLAHRVHHMLGRSV